MAESEALKTLRSTIEKYLDESFGNYLKDKKNNFIMQAGSSQVIIVPVDYIVKARLWSGFFQSSILEPP